MGLNFIKKILIYFSGMFVFLFILLYFDHTHWNGIEEKEDKTIPDKILNRLYFLANTFSTSAYGDITPKSKITRCVIIIVDIFIIVGLFEILHSASVSEN